MKANPVAAPSFDNPGARRVYARCALSPRRSRLRAGAGGKLLAISSAVALAGLLLPVAPAAAQQTGGAGGQGQGLSAQAQAMLSADLNLGPFLLQPGFGIGTGWRSVPDVINADDPTQFERDLVATFSPTLSAALPVRERHLFTLNVGLTYELFRKFEELRTLNYRIVGSYSFTGNRVRVTVRNDTHTRERGRFDPRQPDEVVIGPQLEVDSRTPFLTNQLNITTDIVTSDRTTLTIEGRAQFVNGNEEARQQDPAFDELARAANGSSYTAITTLDYSFSQATTISGSYSITATDPQDPTNIREATNHSVRAGLSWQPPGIFGAQASVGYQTPIRVVPETVGYEGTIFQGGFSVHPIERLTFTLNGNRTPMDSAQRNNPFMVRTGVESQISIFGTSALRFELRGRYYQHDYPIAFEIMGPEGQQGPTDVVDRTDELLDYSGRVEWRLHDSGTLVFEVGQSSRSTNVTSQNQGVPRRSGVFASIGYTFIY